MSTNNNLGFQILRSIRVAVKSSLNVFKGITGLREMLGLDATMNKQRQRVVHILPDTRDRPFDRIFLQNGFKNIPTACQTDLKSKAEKSESYLKMMPK